MRPPISDSQTAIAAKPGFCPILVAVLRWLDAKVGLQFFENILQRRRLSYAGRTEKLSPCACPAMIGVLAQNHTFTKSKGVSEKA